MGMVMYGRDMATIKMLMFQVSYNFITRTQYDLKWICPEIEKVLKRIEDTGNMYPDGAGTYGGTVCLTHEFEKIRKYGSREKGLNAGDTEFFSRRLYLHIYFNDVNRIKNNLALDDELSKLRDEYIAGQKVSRRCRK